MFVSEGAPGRVPSSCINSCIYKRIDTGKMYCFAPGDLHGDLHVDCEDDAADDLDSESTCECLTTLTIPWKLPMNPVEHCIASGTSVVFDLSPLGEHNVDKLDSEQDLDNCNTNDGTASSEATITEPNLPVGTSYFACGRPGHCDAGMKATIRVSDTC